MAVTTLMMCATVFPDFRCVNFSRDLVISSTSLEKETVAQIQRQSNEFKRIGGLVCGNFLIVITFRNRPECEVYFLPLSSSLCSVNTGGATLTNKIEPPVAKAQLLIRKPVSQVFEAMIDPAITSRFWFSKGSGRLDTGKRIRWDWEMYGHHTEVDVKAIEVNKRILVEWDGPENPSLVEWTFEDKGNNTTFVVVKNWGFKGTDDEVVAKAMDSAGGFTFLLAALKVFLEHAIEPNFVVDHAPDSLVERWISQRTAGSGQH